MKVAEAKRPKNTILILGLGTLLETSSCQMATNDNYNAEFKKHSRNKKPSHLQPLRKNYYHWQFAIYDAILVIILAWIPVSSSIPIRVYTAPSTSLSGN